MSDPDDPHAAAPSSSPLATTLTPERWRAVKAVVQAALARPRAARPAFVAAACGGDPVVRAEVEALLRVPDTGDGTSDFLAPPAAAVITAAPDDDAATIAAAEPAAESADGAGAAAPFTAALAARYVVERALGRGGMATVYLARDLRHRRLVAIKVLHPELGALVGPNRFRREIETVANLSHPHILPLHDSGEAGGHLYYVMPYVAGESLRERLRLAGRLPVPDALRVLREIAGALDYAHRRGVVHRDVKPENVLLDEDGHALLADFGIARADQHVVAGATAGVPGRRSVTLTEQGGVIGTPSYMSPEQAFGEAVDHRTDIWSLGIVLYEMLTGVRPFRGPGDRAVLVAALTTDPEPVTSLCVDAPAEVDSVIRRALAKQPAERFASAAELLAALAVPSPGPPADRPAGAPARAPVDGGAGSGSERRDSTPHDSARTRGGERRHVTMVACMIAGYDALVERLSAGEVDGVLARIRDAAAEVAAHHGGIVNHFSGDGLAMLFGVPTAHEDDAVRGVRAALALHAHVADVAATVDPRLSAGLRLRTGVHVGPVVAQRLSEGDRRFRITGVAADVAGRLAAAAELDAVLVSPDVRRLVAPFVYTTEARPIALQPDGAPAVPHRVLGASDVRSRLDGPARTGLTPFVGRERERGALAEHLASARGGMGRFTVLVGEAGAGKSRLLHELRDAAAASGTRVLVGRCDAYGVTTPFLPFVEAVHEALGLHRGGATAGERHDAAVEAVRAIDGSLEEFLPLYLALLAIPSETHQVPAHLAGELFQAAMLEAVAALFTLQARSAPTLLLLEDWHWADEASRAALRQLAEVAPAFPLLLVVTSRPDDAADWGSADHQTLMHLPPLDGPASAAIARAVLGAERVAPGLIARLHERTGGNPFFLEEVCEALREEGAVTVRDGEAAAADASGAVHVPETVQGVLRTRIDRLDGDARDAVCVASVIGREFTRGLLEDVADTGGGLAHALERLKASGLVQQVGVAPEPAYRFKHALTQEVAYDSLLEHQRATLHAAVGRAIERRYATRLDEHVERLAHHFSRAEAWAEAARYGLQAAERATAISQNADALTTLERVEEWVRRLPDDAARRDLHADVLLRQERLSEMLGLRDHQLALVEALIALLAPHGPSERLSQVYLRQGDACTLLRRFEAAGRALETAVRIAGERGDAAGERNALRSIALLRSYEGRHEEAQATIERVLALGSAAGDTRAEGGDLVTLANILRALGKPERALAVLETAQAHAAAADSVLQISLPFVIATVYRDLGDDDTALAYFREAASQAVEQRRPINASFALPAIAHLQLQRGHVEEALATYRQAVEMNRQARYADGSAHACRSLGEVLVGLDRHDEALPHLREAAALFAQLEDRASEALMWWRLATVHERLRRPEDARAAWARVRELHRVREDAAGEAEAAEGMARAERQLSVAPEDVVARYEEALALATRTDDRRRELSVRNALGIVHWERGAYVDAVRHYEAALRLCREDGDRVHEGLILNSLGATLHRLRRWDEARAALAEAVRVTMETGERRLRAYALAVLTDVCLAAGRLDEARASVEGSLVLRRELGDRRGEGWMLERLARVHAAQGAHDAARAAADAGSAIAQEIGDETLQAAVAGPQSHDASTNSPHP